MRICVSCSARRSAAGVFFGPAPSSPVSCPSCVLSSRISVFKSAISLAVGSSLDTALVFRDLAAAAKRHVDTVSS